MRIDFAEIDREELPQTTVRNSFSPSLNHTWKSPFSKDKESLITKGQEEQSLSFSVSYPYEISRSVSPAAVNKEIAYLQAKKILPTSTLKFIQSAISSEMENKKVLEKSIVESEKYQDQAEEKSQLQTTMRSKDAFNWTLKAAQSNLQNCLHSAKRGKKSLYKDVKPRVYNIKKPNQAAAKNHRRDEQQLDGLTLKPCLNYTMNSKIAKQVSKKRGHFFKTFNTTVFETLYNDAAVYSTKKEIQRSQANEESRCSTRRTSRIKIYSTFEERLQTSIQKQANKRKKAQNKLDVDPTTGKKMFVPDTRKSKITYLTHFKSQSRILQFDDVYEGKTTHYSKDSSKLNHSQEMVSTLNNSYEKDLNKSQDSKYRVIRQPLPKENKLADMYADLLWEQNRLNEQELDKQEKQILDGFLYEVKNYEQNYSQNISKQVFIAFFKQIYLNMNLYDRAILQTRLKKQKKDEPQPKLSQQVHSARHLTERKLASSRSQLDHTSKHFFI